MKYDKPLLLEAGLAYRAGDFESFEYSSKRLNGQETILRLHMKNGTILDLPATDDSLKYLAANLAAAFPEHVLQYFFANGWAKRPYAYCIIIPHRQQPLWPVAAQSLPQITSRRIERI